MREKIMVVGATGLIGQSLVNILIANNYKVLAAIKNRQSSLPTQKIKMDLSSPEEIDKAINLEKPDIIINVAGLIGFEKCEKNPAESKMLNSQGVEYLIQSASSYNPLFIQFSTDAVFAGDKGFYAETDIANPQTVYGQTKLAGDEIVSCSTVPFLIIRPSVVYGVYKYEQEDIRFIDAVLKSLSKGENFDAMVNTFNSPTFLDDLCEGTIFLINQRVSGTFHLAGNERLSKYDFACKIAQQFGLNPKKIKPIASESSPLLSIYPRDTSLDISKIKKLGYAPRGVNDGLKAYAQQKKMLTKK